MTTDAAANKKDAVPAGGQHSAETGKPSSQPEVFNKEQVETLIRERHSKLDKQIAELTKAQKAASETAEVERAKSRTAADRLATYEEERARRELDGIKDNPDALSLWQAKQAYREMVRDLEAKQEAFEAKQKASEADIEEMKVVKKFKLASEITSRAEYAGVKAETLVELTDGSSDKMESLAKLLKAGMGQVPTTTTNVGSPDSGKSTGGAGEPSADKLNEMSMAEYADYWAKRQKKK